jgi:uncharacterized protein (DUF2236 family)
MSSHSPCVYKPATGDKLAQMVADGVPLAEACKQLKISRRAPYEWLATSDEWAQLYARAREMLAHKYAAEVVTIADDQSIPPDSRRVMCDSRKWAAAKLLPRVYNDRLIVAGDADNPVRVNVVDYSQAPVIEHQPAPVPQLGPPKAA